MTFAPDPQRVLDALDALDAIAAGDWTVTDAVALLGADAWAEGLLGVTHVYLAYLTRLGADPRQITGAARQLVGIARDRR